MIKIIYRNYTTVIQLYFVLSFVCENMIQIITTLQDYEYVQFYGYSFFTMHMKTQARNQSQKYVTGSISQTVHVF